MNTHKIQARYTLVENQQYASLLRKCTHLFASSIVEEPNPHPVSDPRNLIKKGLIAGKQQYAILLSKCIVHSIFIHHTILLSILSCFFCKRTGNNTK
jgi:hypothetical protein